MDKSKSDVDIHKTETLWSNEDFIQHNEKLLVLFDDQQFCDITLISGDDEFRVMAHKHVLASVSKYFLQIFDGKSDANELKMDQIDGRSLKLILNFIYKGVIELTIGTAGSVLVGSHVLEVSALEKLCCAYIKRNIDVSNCLGIAELAKRHNYDDLYDVARSSACENFVALRDENEFYSQDIDQLCELISNDDLRVPSEGDVFHSIMAWIDYAKDDRKQFMEKLLTHVRFPLLSLGFIGGIIDIVGESTEMLRIVCNAFTWHAVPDKRSNIYPPERSRIRNFKDVIVAISGCENSNMELSVGLCYSGLKEWVYTKWPAIPYPRKNLKFTILGKKLLIAGGKEGDNFSNRVDCLNLDTLEWSEFPQLSTSPTNALFTLNGRVYALSDSFSNKLAESFEKWTPFQISDASSLEDIGGVHATYKDSIYFPQNGYYCTYSLVEDKFDMQHIRRASTSSVIGVHIIRHLGFEYLVEITPNSAYVYDLSTALCVIKNTVSFDWEYKRTALHGKNVIIYGRNQFYEYNVFTNQMNALPYLVNDKKRVDILLTNSNNGIGA